VCSTADGTLNESGANEIPPRPTRAGRGGSLRGLPCMTASPDWPRNGPATYRTTGQEDGLRGEANPQVERNLLASPQVVEAASRSLSRWRHGFKSRWDYLTSGARTSAGILYVGLIPFRLITRSSFTRSRMSAFFY
jgi:hypothetical protein